MKHDKQIEADILEILRSTPKNACGKRFSSKKYTHIQAYIKDNTKFLDVYDVDFLTRVWHVLNNHFSVFVCETCGIPLKNQIVNVFSGKHNRFCCPRCECTNDSVKDTLRKTNLKKYGVEWSFQSENNKQKSKETMLKKHGVEFAQQSKSIKAKSLSTMVERYGTQFPLQSIEIKAKMRRTRRTTEYKKFLDNKYVQPLFSLEEYEKYGNSRPYLWKCAKCNTEFFSEKNDSWFKQGAVKAYARCEKCFPYDFPISYEEKKIVDIIKSSKFECIENTRSIISPYEIDAYIPEKRLAIEYDGLYWHSDDLSQKQTYHLQKTEACEKQGIQLIHIFENEWLTKQDIVKSRIKNLLGVYDKTIYARKCVIKEVDSKTSREFQEQNHIQGAVNSQVNLGLFCKDEFVSLMTFSKARFSKKYEWELVRFCSKLGYHVPGAAGKLLKYFERNWKPKSLVSYADRRWSQGKVYTALGFALDHVSRPNYWYWKTGSFHLYSRVSFQKHTLNSKLKFFDHNKSEAQNMLDNGYHKIFDCGNLVFGKIYI